MIKRPDTKGQRLKRHARVRGKISGTAERPRLCVFRSENHIYAQIIDDVAGKTLCSASSVEKDFDGKGSNVEGAKKSDRPWQSVPRKKASKTLCLTAAAIFITAVCRPWRKQPVRAA